MKLSVRSGLLILAFWNYAAYAIAKTPPIIAPFDKVDQLAIMDWWDRGDNEIINLKVDRDSTVAFGIYMVHYNTLKMSAQLYPLYPDETREVRLEIEESGSWKEKSRNKGPVPTTSAIRITTRHPSICRALTYWGH